MKEVLLITLPSKPSLFSVFLIVLSWTSTFTWPTKQCKVWKCAFRFFAVSEHCSVWVWWNFPGTPNHEKICMCLKCCALMKNLFPLKVLDNTLFGKDLLICSLASPISWNDCFSLVISENWFAWTANSCFYKDSYTCWWSVNQDNWISSYLAATFLLEFSGRRNGVLSCRLSSSIVVLKLGTVFS